MTATFASVSATTGEADGTLGVTIPAPSGILTGDLLTATVVQNTVNGTWGLPSGWSTLSDDAGSGNTIQTAIFYKTAVLADESATDYIFTRGTAGANKKIGRNFRATGQDDATATSWIDFTPTANVKASSTTAVAPDETATENNVLLGRFGGVDRNRMSGATAPSGLTDEDHADVDETSTAVGMGSGWQFQASSGSTGTKTWTLEGGTSDESNGYTWGVRSAAAVGGASLLLMQQSFRQ